jgi:hypothetical protein
MINVTTIDFLQFMRLVMFKLGDEEPAPDISGLLHSFELKLKAARSRGQKVLLVVDEAQNCSAALLESIRMLLNLAQPGGQVLQLILAGQIGLEDVLACHELRQLRQRIRISYRLECLNRAESEAYVVHRLRVAGCESRLFDTAALDRVFRLSGGVPRLVNQVADRALLAGFVDNAKLIRASHVDDVESMVEVGLAGDGCEADSNVNWSGHGPASEPPVALLARRVTPCSDQGFAERRRGGLRGRGRLIAGIVAVSAVAVVFAIPRLQGTREATTVRKDAGVRPAVSPMSASSVVLPASTDSSEAVVFTAEPAQFTAVAGRAMQEHPATADTAVNLAVNQQRSSVEVAHAPTPARMDPDVAEVALPSESNLEVLVEQPVGPVSVHVFSFRTPDRADISRGRLERAGITTFVLKEQGANSVVWYRVYIGPIANRADAATLIDSLRAAGTIEYASITSKAPARP